MSRTRCGHRGCHAQDFAAAIAASGPGTQARTTGGDDAMPAGVDADEERALYLTPGGIYTEADIKANGSVTAGDKYKGKMAKHDMKPKAGDKSVPDHHDQGEPQVHLDHRRQDLRVLLPPVHRRVRAARKDLAQGGSSIRASASRSDRRRRGLRESRRGGIPCGPDRRAAHRSFNSSIPRFPESNP
jgi:hypothetical protein